jgi:hypothetical protein
MPTGRWSSAILNEYIAPGVSTFTAAEVPDLTDRHSQAPHWLANHFLNSVLRAAYGPGFRQAALGYLRRAHHAFRSYHDARRLTLAFVQGHEPGVPRLREYYDAVAAWETFVLQCSMAYDLFRWLNQGQGAFEKGDGSKEQRLYRMANQIKHVPSCIDSGQCTANDTIPLWLTNEGLNSFGLSVSFAEAGELLSDLARVADDLQDPLKFTGRAQ